MFLLILVGDRVLFERSCGVVLWSGLLESNKYENRLIFGELDLLGA
jgi:hypothetical protein